ncbi:inositol monophosphatase 3-like [Leptonychotes weddellii]|uniref:3'(2'),5'-bisphosphate nucleotidase n=1 Tax=Leptonychotes weddellii TaxID=9713 RepID=A0A2U3Z8L9_LEPWE|nr:inositol monophosphatase 3-like [Leptonychotes weddellii]
MAPMGIRLSPLGVAVFCLLGLGVLYHLYSGFLAGRFSLFGLGGEPGGGGAAGPAAAADGGTVDLREMLAVSVLAAVRGGDEVRRVRESNVLHEKSKGKTREGAEDKMTSGDVLSNRKMFYLLKTAFPNVQGKEHWLHMVSCWQSAVIDRRILKQNTKHLFFFCPTLLYHHK